ncbi:MAG: MarR family winged helix-turn-helix transcriptional regulator [Eubacteriales bacterium]|jgi:DNA-binding MarR family transcriptional regulator
MDSYERSVTLLRFCRGHKKLSVSMFRERGISSGQPPILDYLSRNSGCIQNDLSRYCHLEPATITSILTTMERDGLIERRASPTDRRVWLIYLTDAGRALYDSMQDASARVADICFDGFTESESEQILVYLKRITANIRRVNGGCCRDESQAEQK